MIPGIPKVVAQIIKTKRHHLIPFTIAGPENIKEQIAETAITITMIGETTPAETAASPKTIAPKMEMELPDKLGILISLSLSISKIKLKTIASIIAGKGTPSL